ncbi:MAG: DedA family protein [Alphaproteobacteria bacterium]
MTIVHLSEFVAHYGYLAVFGLILFQTVGIPLPGEAALIAAAVYAQHTHKLDVIDIILISALATSLGGVMGYWIGRRGGYPLLMRHGHHVGLNPARMRLGEYLFQFHGGKILLFGRVIAVLRTYQSVLAGIYRMPFRRFVAFSGLGALLWAAAIGYGAYGFGGLFNRMAGVLAWGTLALGLGIMFAIAIYLKRQENVLQARADAALLGAEQGA